ncbi:helix-turn-helix domain-containing protein [Catenovulum sp. SM1970]|uniref:helix-turn-helix domain-containing protein n=1 Tax=Marinifaba aquimaris TaxID=2741323 RepID=UPI001574E922|nr:helix-turn-helix domain-containing protein [Marinifaba aquimaris]NTS76633.1 helix-turn-helix domain-containing protein [Marinifaba aquimaris]
MIKQRRLTKGWSQEQLAEMAGLTARTIQRIESGNKPSLESLKALAAVFEISIDQLKSETFNTSDSGSTNSKLKQQQEMKAFYIHFFLFLSMMPAIFAVNFLVSPQYIWSWWGLIGWGMGISIHGIVMLAKYGFVSVGQAFKTDV